MSIDFYIQRPKEKKKGFEAFFFFGLNTQQQAENVTKTTPFLGDNPPYPNFFFKGFYLGNPLVPPCVDTAIFGNVVFPLYQDKAFFPR